MNLRQLSDELLSLLTEHPEFAELAVLCEDGEFEVQGVWCGDAKRNYPEVWLVGYDGSETPGTPIEAWTAEEIDAAKARGLAMRDSLFGAERGHDGSGPP